MKTINNIMLMRALLIMLIGLAIVTPAYATVYYDFSGPNYFSSNETFDSVFQRHNSTGILWTITPSGYAYTINGSAGPFDPVADQVFYAPDDLMIDSDASDGLNISWRVSGQLPYNDFTTLWLMNQTGNHTWFYMRWRNNEVVFHYNTGAPAFSKPEGAAGGATNYFWHNITACSGYDTVIMNMSWWRVNSTYFNFMGCHACPTDPNWPVGAYLCGGDNSDPYVQAYDSATYPLPNISKLAFSIDGTTASAAISVSGIFTDNWFWGTAGLPRISGHVYDSADQSVISGKTVELHRLNETLIDTTDSNGYFSFSNLEPGVAYELAIPGDDWYESWECPGDCSESSIILNATSNKQFSVYLVSRIGFVEVAEWIDTNYAEYELNNHHLQNITLPKDATIYGISANIRDSHGEPISSPINVSVDTTCSYSTAPTDYFIVPDHPTKDYSLQATISGVNQSLLLATCADNDYFKITYSSMGLSVTLNATFEGQEMTTRNFRAYRGSQAAASYSSLMMLFDVFDADHNFDLTNSSNSLMCNLTLYNISTSTNVSIPFWPNASENGYYSENTVYINVSDIEGSPSSVVANVQCIADGYDVHSHYSAPITVGADVFNYTDCRIENAVGIEYDYMKPNQMYYIVCSLNTMTGASLVNMGVIAVQDDYNRHEPLIYSGMTDNYYNWQAPFLNVLPKGWWTWYLDFTSKPASLEGTVEFETLTKVYDVPPKKISPEYCDGINCPILVNIGDRYYCSLKTEFETEYTKIDMWLEVDGSKYDMTYNTERDGNIWTHSYEVSNVGSTAKYGIKNSTENLKCGADFYINEEHIHYLLTSPYNPEKTFDIFGIAQWLLGVMTSQDPLGDGARGFSGFIGGIAGWIYKLFTGQGNYLEALFWIIVLCLFAALILVFVGRKGGHPKAHHYVYRRFKV